MPTAYVPHDVRSVTVDENGLLTFYKDRESVLSYTLRWEEALEGDRIFTSVWSSECGGISLGTDSMTPDSTTITISLVGGVAKNIVTTEKGLTHVRRIRFIERET